MIRYSEITDKNPREIVMLRGSGCVWRKCRFCDYHLDKSPDASANFALNTAELKKVTGKYHQLEIINSGSFCDLDEQTMSLIETVCIEKGIHTLHFECHWMHRAEIAPLKARFSNIGVTVKIKLGVETFDSLFRESYLVKGIDTDSPKEIAKYADEVCLLQGIPGQTKESMIQDIETGLRFFERVCVNIMVANRMPIQPDARVISIFENQVAPLYIDNPRVDILMQNTDYGVGGLENAE